MAWHGQYGTAESSKKEKGSILLDRAFFTVY